jgi:hypothetical protein
VLLENAFAEVRIPEDLGEQSAPDIFAGVDRNDGDASVRMSQVLMATACANYFKAQLLQSRNELATGNAG